MFKLDSPYRDPDESTEFELLAYFGGHTIRGHRMPSKYTLRTKITALLGVACTTLFSACVGGDSNIRGAVTATHGSLTAQTARVTDNETLSVGTLGTSVVGAAELVERIHRGGPGVSRALTRKTLPSRWVTPLKHVDVSSCFGSRWGTKHEGIDMRAPAGTSIRATGAGRVVQAGWNYSGYGYSVVIDHGDTLTLYGHASRVLVSVGQRVTTGTRIALVGSTGDSTGNHLHFGVAIARNVKDIWGTFINPAPWLRSHNVTFSGCM